MIDLSTRDKQILEYLRQYSTGQHNAPAPSYRDIVEACGLSSTGLVKASLKRLKAANLIEWYPNIARSIRVIRPREERRIDDTPESAVINRRPRQSEGWA